MFKLGRRIVRITLNGVTGAEIVRFMRANKVTIRELKARMEIALKAIRKVRVQGTDFYGALDYWNGITGQKQLTPRLRAMLKSYVDRCAHKRMGFDV